MKRIFYLVSIILLSACTEQFEELNTDPNDPVTASENLLLPSIVFDLSNITVNQTYGFGDVIGQYTGNYEFNDIDIYRWQADDRFWSPMYGILQDVSDLKIIAEDNNNQNYKAVALILEAYIYSIITDAYGDIPMNEANRTEEGITAPVYDKQEDIYEAILSKLEEANTIIDVSQTIKGDGLYNGNLNKWKKFANSLRIRLLMRISEVRNISTDFDMILNNPSTYPIFTSNEDNAIYKYSGVVPDVSNVSQAGGGRDYEYFLRIPTTHFLGLLATNNDPRLELWISPKEGTDDRTLGVIPGQPLGEIGRPADFSRKSVAFYTEAARIQGIFITYSELSFILAEAREKNIISTSTAKNYYDIGVQSSFDQWGLVMPTDFLTVTAPYDNGTDRLYEQKWLALYHTGVEPWFDWKRTGKPSFIMAGTGNLNGDKIPVRLRYPSLEQSVNASNYEQAASDMGGDDINASSWWW
ncbi:SusD/RagB family nutrient-binding outer membrane lipoprotein [uncultured Aquimarina sp.]|uniref:SusD/RagB family nutrient-binding outer membrane lipoprotein n=1 Tax=uncultured Aquimarina sp. TaxID=575652 RepID=UPI00261106C5|nr:SusD/RagB family nutrient-binding outer membrane lipoprotein [uncultured Aquimarina sp.]